MRLLAQARNPYSRSWLWIPGSRFARPGMTERELPPALPLHPETRNIRRFGLADRRGCARKTRRRGRLGDAVAGDENVSGGHVRMLGRFRHGQDRREADVGAFHDLAPFVTRLALEHLCEFFLQRWPRVAIHLRIEIAIR